MTPDLLEKLRHVVIKAVNETSLSGVAKRGQHLTIGDVRSFRDGRMCKSTTIKKLCDVFGFEFYVGPPRDTNTQSIEDRDLAEVLAVITDAWEFGTERDRGVLLGRFRAAFREDIESATVAPGPRLAGLVAIKGADE